MSDPRRATLAALQRSTGGGTLVYRAKEHEPPLWWRIAVNLYRDERSLRAVPELRHAVIGRGVAKRLRERMQHGLRLLESEGAITRRGEWPGVIVVDRDRLTELLGEDPQRVSERASHRRRGIVDETTDRG